LMIYSLIFRVNLIDFVCFRDTIFMEWQIYNKKVEMLMYIMMDFVNL
jgi:hypothetical protein